MTLGARGAVVMEPNRAFAVPALPVTAVDTTGAGDAFAGVLAASLDAGDDIEGAVRRATVGAALACQTVGAQTSLPSGADVDRALSKLSPLRPLD